MDRVHHYDFFDILLIEGGDGTGDALLYVSDSQNDRVIVFNAITDSNVRIIGAGTTYEEGSV